MKCVISFTELNWKFLLFACVYLAIMFILNFMSYILKNSSPNMAIFTKKIPIMLFINHFFLSFCVFKLVINIIEKKIKINEEIKKGTYAKERGNQIELIYENPLEAASKRNLNTKDIVFLFFILLIDYMYNVSLMFNQKNNEENSELVLSQYYKFLDVLILLLFFKINKKTQFFRHQYFSLAIIIIFGLGKFLSNIYFNKVANEELTNKFDLKLILFLVICPLADSIKIFYFKQYLTFKFVSPFMLSYLIGFFYIFVSIIILVTFYFVDPEIELLQKYFSMKGLELPSVIEILLLFAYSFLYSLEYFLDLVILNKFTPFHLILIATLGDLITDCFNIFKKSDNLDVVHLVVSIILYVFEILGILIFIETIVLQCCDLDKYVSEKVTKRGEEDVKMGMEMAGRTSSFGEEEMDGNENGNGDDNENGDNNENGDGNDNEGIH